MQSLTVRQEINNVLMAKEYRSLAQLVAFASDECCVSERESPLQKYVKMLKYMPFPHGPLEICELKEIKNSTLLSRFLIAISRVNFSSEERGTQYGHQELKSLHVRSLDSDRGTVVA